MEMVHPDTQAGDLVCVMYGCPVPLVLRDVQRGEAGSFEDRLLEKRQIYGLIGTAYVRGIMDGEVMKDSALDDLENRTFISNDKIHTVIPEYISKIELI